MTEERFTGLVRRAERLAAEKPGFYRARVAALAGLGYLYVWALLLLTLVLVGLSALLIGTSAVAAVKLIVPLGAFAWILIKSLWIRFDPPEGVVLSRRDFPDLHEALESIRRQVRGPRLHAVLLDDQFNASITQVPRLGVLGFHRNYLVVGLPLLLALSREEFDAVLAHEYGHLSGAHGKFGAWIYRIRTTWMRLMETFSHQRGLGSRTISRFFNWYAPYFHAYSFVLARANEYEADRAAAAYAGSGPAGSALLRISTLSPHLDRSFWPDFFRDADHGPEPRRSPFRNMADQHFLPSRDQAEALLAEALGLETDLADTHPSLADRLKALGVEARLGPQPEGSAANAYLGRDAERLVAHLDDRWRESVRPWFADRFSYVDGLRTRLAEIRAAPGEPDAARLVAEAQILDELEGREAALSRYEAAVRLDPAHPLGRCIVGFERLRAGDESGLEMMELAMQDDPSLLGPGCEAVRDHYARQGRMELAQAYHDRVVERHEELERIRRERDGIPVRRIYLPPTLGDEAMDTVRSALRSSGMARRAWIVRKPLTLSEAPCHVLLVELKRWRFVSPSRNVAYEIANALTIPDDIQVLVLDKDLGKLRKYVRKVPGARVRFG